MTRSHRTLLQQNGAITLLVAIGLVVLASLASFYSARSVLMDQLASHNHARASQARLAADAALASAQATLPSTGPEVNALFNTLSTCPAGVSGPQWQCARLSPTQHPAMPQAQLSATAMRDLVQSPHVLTLHASANISGQNSQAKVRENVFVPTVAPAPGLSAQTATPLVCTPVIASALWQRSPQF